MLQGVQSQTVKATASSLTNQQKTTQKLIKYVNNEALQEVPDTFSSSVKDSTSGALVFEGIPFLAFLKNRAKSGNSNIIKNQMVLMSENAQKSLKEIFNGTGKLKDRIADYIKVANQNKSDYAAIKSTAKNSAKFEKFAAKATKAQQAGKAAKAAKYTEKAAKAANSATNAAKGIGTASKAGGFLKSSGAGIMLAFSGIIEGVTEVLPTFKELGTEKGMKQLGKSAIKVAGDTVGFIAGEQAGLAIGTAIGTAIFPGVGTAIGGVVGMIGGMLGSFAMGKVTKAITGKTEREKAKEEQEKANASEISNDDKMLQELKEAAALKLQEEANTGNLSEDSQEILKLLEEEETQSNTQNNSENPFAA